MFPVDNRVKRADFRQKSTEIRLLSFIILQGLRQEDFFLFRGIDYAWLRYRHLLTAKKGGEHPCM